MITMQSAEWGGPLQVTPLDVVMVSAMTRLDGGQGDVEILALIDGRIEEAFQVSAGAAIVILERLKGGWHVPPAVYWYELDGFPVLGKLLEKYRHYHRSG